MLAYRVLISYLSVIMNWFSKSISFFLAFIVLFSTTCFGADIHYCEGEIESFSLYSQAEPCGKHKTIKPKKVSKCCIARKAKQAKALKSKLVFKKKKCCHNEQVAFKSDLNQDSGSIDVSTLNSIHLNAVLFGAKTVQSWVSDIKVYSFRGPPESHFRPNFQILYQVFII